MNSSIGLIPGPRVDLALGDVQVVCRKNSAKHNERESHTPFFGLQSISPLTASRFVGVGSSDKLVGTHTSVCGKSHCAILSLSFLNHFLIYFCRLAFALYLLTIVLYIFVIRLGAYFTMLTGVIMILACFAYGIIIINDPPMKIPFANPEEQVVFVEPHFGWSWYLPLFTGIAVLFLGLAVLLLDFFVPRKIAVVFHHSVVEEDEFFVVSGMEFSFLPFSVVGMVHDAVCLRIMLHLNVVKCYRRM